MKKIVVKIIFSMLLIMFILGAIGRLSMLIFKIADVEPIQAGGAFVAILFFMAISLTLFIFAVNKIIVKRLQKVSKATKELANGNFDIMIDSNGRDEIGALSDDFNAMAQELKANQYLSKDFIRNVSHEIKTPISSISGFAEMIENESSSEDIKEYARIIIRESERLALMSKAMLQISLLDSTTIVKKEDTFKPSAQIRMVIANLQPEWEKKNIEFEVNLEELIITSNEQLLYLVWQNLINNAVKFSKDNGKILVILIKDKNGCKFSVSDSGEGIKPEDKEKIFTQFFVADKSRNAKGTGLGLAICKTVVDKLGGTIFFESIDGIGTTFTVRV
jgi:signal transduction histidine kinase